MSFKRLKLNRELVHNCVIKATNKEILPIKSNNSDVIKIRYNVDTNSILDLFYNKDGTTTISWTGKSPEFAELIANEIKDNCVVDLPDPTRALYLKGFSQENIDEVMSRFRSHNLTVTNLEDTEYSKRYSITNSMDESIKVHYFPSTGALNFQGKGYTIYSDLLEGMDDWVSIDDVIDSNLSANNIEFISTEDLVKTMKEAFPNSYKMIKGAIANIMSSSFFLTRIENEGLPDYSWMVFPILRGFEGYIKKMLILKGIRINKNFGEVFEPEYTGATTYKFLGIHYNSINDSEYCDLLIHCYNYLNANRHGLFHVDGIISATRVINRETALEIFNEIIDIIETTTTKLNAIVSV